MTLWQAGGFQLESTRFGRKRTSAFLAVLALIAMGSPLQGAPAKPDKDEGPPEAINLPLETRDGVSLRATFYPGSKGKKTVPIVILHEWKGNRAQYKDLALMLQAKGHAVLVPDLRGHGESTSMVQRGQEQVKLSAIRTKKKDIDLMVSQDMEAVKRYLMEQNNQEELNIEKLCIIGVEMGAVVAANWALQDWAWPVLPSFKQGQDVKALVLVSPEWSFKGATMAPAIDNKELQGNLSVMVMVGSQDKKALQTAEKTHNVLKRFHAEPSEKEARLKKTLYMIELDTSLQSAKLIEQADLKAKPYIAAFIDARLVEQSFPWSLRQRP